MGTPIPFVGSPQQRATGTTDQRYVNVLFDLDKSQLPTNVPVAVVKRPGLANSTQPPGGAATGRGIFAWGATGKVYSVFDNKIWSNTTDLGVTLAGSTGRVWFVEKHVSTGTRHLIVSDGADNYNITTADAITQIDETDDAQYPTSNLGSIVYHNGYVFQAKSNGEIWNTDLNSATAWTSTSFLTVNASHGNDLEAIHKQKDQVIAFGKNRIEFYYDVGNSGASPLGLISQNTLGFGLAHKNSLAFSGETACFVSENSADGDTRSVKMMVSLSNVKDVSTPYINRFLAAEGTSISSCTSWMERVAGQLVYVLNLSSANRTFVYSVDNDMWSEWEIAAGGAKFNGMAATSLNGTVYVQDATNGRVYTFPISTYQDSGSNFTVTLQTNRQHFGTYQRKFMTSLDLIADTTTGTCSVSWSDNDFTSFTTARSIDMTRADKRLTNCGSFYGRSIKFTYAANAAFRAMAYVPEFKSDSRVMKRK